MKPKTSLVAYALSVAVLGACDGGQSEISETRPPSDDEAPADEGTASPPQQNEPGRAAPHIPTSAGYASVSALESLFAAHPPDVAECDSLVQANALAVAGGRVYWHLFCWASAVPDFHLVASAPVAGGTSAVVWRSEDYRAFISVGAHVVIRRVRAGSAQDTDLFVVAAGSTTPSLLPDSNGCIAVASDAGHVYCLAGAHDEEKALKAWTIDGAGPMTVASALGKRAVAIAADGTTLVVAEPGSYPPQLPQGSRPSPRRDGSLRRVDPSTGTITTFRDALAPAVVVASRGTLLWTDDSEVKSPYYRAWMTRDGLAPIEVSSELFDANGRWRAFALDVDDTQSTLWIGTTQASSDRVLAPTVRVRHVLHPTAEVTAVGVDASHVYWATSEGIFRRTK